MTPEEQLAINNNLQTHLRDEASRAKRIMEELDDAIESLTATRKRVRGLLETQSMRLDRLEWQVSRSSSFAVEAMLKGSDD